MKRLAAFSKACSLEKESAILSKEIPSLLLSQAKDLDGIVNIVLKAANMELGGEAISGPALIHFNRMQAIMSSSIDESLDILEESIDQQGEMLEGIIERVESLDSFVSEITPSNFYSSTGDEETLSREFHESGDEEIEELIKALKKTIEEGASFVEELKETISEAILDFEGAFKEARNSSEESFEGISLFEEVEDE